MAMKQTQTKLFDFADVGLDFSAGSKNLFPDRFKKMLALGYNEQTVSSVAVSGNQLTFTYGGTHGYVADRVLKVSAPELLSINGGEFVIDSVTKNTVTMTIDGAPTSIAGNFTTKVASLGWELMYEQAHIHIYKFKHIDDSDMYIRLCFQNSTAIVRNCIAVGIGRTINQETGVITDSNCLTDLASCATVADATSNIRWDFSNQSSNINNYTYSQGYSTFGRAMAIGSVYHFGILYSPLSTLYSGYHVGVYPMMSHYDQLNYPALFCYNNNAPSSSLSSYSLTASLIYIGNQRCITYDQTSESAAYALKETIAFKNFLPSNIDNFNTTTAKPLLVFTQAERQCVGAIGGIYQVMYTSSGYPALGNQNNPHPTYDIDFSNKVIVHPNSVGSSAHAWIAIPVEEVKIGA